RVIYLAGVSYHDATDSESDTLAWISNFWGGEPEKFTLTVQESPSGWGSAVDATNDGPYPAGSSVSLVATPNSNTVFSRWSRGGSTLSTNANYTYTTRSQNDTVLGEFVAKKYALTVNVSPIGGGTTNITTGNYESGETVPLTATPASGYNFVNWTKGATVLSTNSSYNHTKLSQAEEITANFEAEPETCTLTVTVSPPGGGTTNETSVVHTVGQTIPLVATPSSDYV